MDNLPDLAFEQILSYLSIKDRLRSMAVSKSWYTMINSFKVKSLCYSSCPSGFIKGKSRWVSGAFAQNFISSTRFASFFNTFGPTILSNMKHLRICDLNEENPTALIENLQSFGHLEVFDLVRFNYLGTESELSLSLPMLKSFHTKGFSGFDRLTLDAPRLQQVRIHECSCLIDLVQVNSVELVSIDDLTKIPVKKLKNLKQLYFRYSSSSSIDPTLLSDLEQLTEVRLNNRENAIEIFEQKLQYDRADLKVYLYGLILNGLEDPEMNVGFRGYGKEYFVHLAGNQSRLADEIPFYNLLHYSAIERVAPEAAINVVKRLTDFDTIYVDKPVRDVEGFLDFLRNFDSIARLYLGCDQPQELFDRLPECCAVQKLSIGRLPSDPQFLVQLKHLIELHTGLLDVELIRRILEELKFLSSFAFHLSHVLFRMRIEKSFRVSVEGVWTNFSDVNAVIQFIVEKNRAVELAKIFKKLIV